MSTEANKVKGIATMSADDTRRWAILSQLVLGALTWWALANIIHLAYRGLEIPHWDPFGWHDANWVAFALTGATLIYMFRNVATQEFANDVVIELKKVTWPTWKETRQSTMVVLITVAIVGLILGGFDLIWAKLTRYLLTGGTT